MTTPTPRWTAETEELVARATSEHWIVNGRTGHVTSALGGRSPMTQPDTARPRSCPTCRSIGTPRDGCQDLWHIQRHYDVKAVADAILDKVGDQMCELYAALPDLIHDVHPPYRGLGHAGRVAFVQAVAEEIGGQGYAYHYPVP